MSGHFHVTSTRNRASITAHGLDWTKMSAARGIAGSLRPEQAGSFVCVAEWEVDWFVRMNNTGGPVDVWAIEGVDPSDLVVSGEGHHYVPHIIPTDRLTLLRQDIPEHNPADSPPTPTGKASGQHIGVFITFADEPGKIRRVEGPLSLESLRDLRDSDQE